MTDLDALVAAQARAMIEATDQAKRVATKRQYEEGTILEVDPHSRSVRVRLDGGGDQWMPVVDDTYVPRVGHRIVIPMNGDLPIGARPPVGPDASVIHNPDGVNVGEDLLRGAGVFETTVDPFDPGTNTVIATSALQFHSGAKSLLLERTVSTGDPVARIPFADAPKCVPGKTYNLSVWARGAVARNKQVDIEFYDAAGTLLQTTTSLQALIGTTWTELWVSGIAPGAAYKVVLVLHGAILATAPVGEDHFFDDVTIYEAITGMGVSGAQAWRFDVDAESWGGATWTPNGALSGEGCIVTNAGEDDIRSPQGASGQVVVGGKSRHTAFLYITPIEGNGTERTWSLSMDWWTAGGVYISGITGPAKVVRSGVWTQLIVPETLAPPTAGFVSLRANGVSVGGAQQWRIDTAAVTLAPITRIRRNTDPTYLLPGKTTSIEVNATATGIAIVQFPEGLNGDTTTMIPVVPGDSWRLQCDYINKVTNTVLRNIAHIATWYDEAGGFIGIDLKQTPIGTNPGTGWQFATDTFTVPGEARYLRHRIVWLPGAVGEAFFLQNVVAQRVPDSDAAVMPRGRVYALETSASFDDVGIFNNIAANGWVMSPWFLVCENPGVPITVEATFMGFTQAVGGFDWERSRIAITFDGGLTWTYGQHQWSLTDAGYITLCSIAAKHVKTDLPIGNVYCWFENEVYGFHSAHCIGRLSWRTNPA